MSIIRVVKRKKDFTTVSNEPFRNRLLNFDTRGLLIFLLTKPDDWDVDTENLQRESPNAGRDKVLRMLRELTNAGLLWRHKTRLKDGTWDWETVVYEHPSLNPHYKPPSPEKPDTVKAKNAKTGGNSRTPQTDFQGAPLSAEPSPAKPPTRRNTEGRNNVEANASTLNVKERERALRKEIAELPKRKRIPQPSDAEWSTMLLVFKDWRDARGRSKQTKLTPQRGRAILERLRFGFTREDIALAVKGCGLSPRHMGVNDTGTIYDDIELICRTDQKVEEFKAIAERAERKPTDGESRKGTRPAHAESERGGRLRESAEAFGWADLEQPADE